MRNKKAKDMALGGLMAALAVVIMSVGGLIPLTTYVCCLLCMVLCGFVLRVSGKRVTWTWYAAVSILGLLLGTDKEAAVLFVFVGYYPILKPSFDKYRVIGFFGKLVFFNVVILIAYLLLIYLLGMTAIVEEFAELGILGIVVALILGNVTFLLFDRLLRILDKMRRS